jgi:sulfonate transport system substrate-binding protein
VTKGSYAQHFLDLVLEKAGLAPGDIELINMPPSDIPPAIISGAIAAGATWEPYITRYENEKAVRVLVDATGLEKGVQPIIASGNAVKNKRLLVEAVLRAYGRGADFIRSNPNEAAMLAAKDSSMPPDLLEKVFAKQDFAPALSDEDISEFKKTETYMRKINLLRKDVDVDDWVDRSFVNAGKVR